MYFHNRDKWVFAASKDIKISGETYKQSLRSLTYIFRWSIQNKMTKKNSCLSSANIEWNETDIRHFNTSWYS